MKYLLLSDIHGSATRLNQVMDFFDSEHYDMLLLLGDLLNYGPRNGLCDGLDAMAVAERLNKYSDRIIAVRGNCDSEVDQMLLNFPMLAGYSLVVDNGRRLFLTHGHLHSESDADSLPCDIFCYGHTHLQTLQRIGNKVIVNTGSITFPKGGNPPTFATLDGSHLAIRKLVADGIRIHSEHLLD